MKRVVAVGVLLALCFPAVGAEPILPTQKQIAVLCEMLAALTEQVAALAYAAASEDVGPILQMAIAETVMLCAQILGILGAMGYEAPQPEGTKG